jgi:GT2 family glycosyltransferase
VTNGTAVREIHFEDLPARLQGLDGYSRALIVWRFQSAVVGRSMVPVRNGIVHAETLQKAISGELVWFIWIRLLQRRALGPFVRATVVVCTRDRTQDLIECLPGLHKLALAGHEVLVVDSCPSDSATALLVKRYPEIRYILEPRPGLGIARNSAIRAASSDILAFTDDDAQVDSVWLEALLHNFHDPLTALVLGVTLPLEMETPSQRWFEETNGFVRNLRRTEADLRIREPLHAGGLGAGVNMAIRKSVAIQIGAFDDALGPGTLTMSGDDFDFYHRTLAAGYRIVCEPAALI